MGGRDDVLNALQARTVAHILENEFRPYVLQADPNLTGFAVVYPWAKKRQYEIFLNESSFKTPEVLGDIQKFKKARTPSSLYRYASDPCSHRSWIESFAISTIS